MIGFSRFGIFGLLNLAFLIVPIIVLYFVVKFAVKNAIKELKNEGVVTTKESSLDDNNNDRIS